LPPSIGGIEVDLSSTSGCRTSFHAWADWGCGTAWQDAMIDIIGGELALRRVQPDSARLVF
jgi:hypothetical protein